MMQGSDSFRLVVRRGPQPNQVYELNKDIVTLGRDITNDITINDPEVSRHHLRLTRGAGGFTLEDLGSTNGTFVNGQRLTGARPLRTGDMVGLGETVTLAYDASSRAAAPSYNDAGAEITSPGAMGGRSPSPYAPQQAPMQQPQQDYGYRPPAQAPQQAPMSSYAPPAAPPQAPPGTGYDYDPYEVREEEPRNTTRWILLGCVGLSLLCCCGTLVGAFIIDQMCLWNRIPILYDVLRLVGYTQSCPIG
jgi:hypothetical protein